MPVSLLVIDLILGLVVIEAVALTVWLARRGRLDVAPALIAFLASGAVLLSALRVLLAGSAVGGGMVLGLLALSFPLHLAALVLGWRLITRTKKGGAEAPPSEGV